MIHIRLMTADDVDLGMRLKAQAGWNQSQSDWQRFLRMQPDGCFVAEFNGEPAGTTVTCVFGPVAWVAMVLVDECLRGRGIGKSLLQHALEYLDERGVTSVRLDATPLGQSLYERFGFSAQYSLIRHAGVLKPHSQREHVIRCANEGDFESIVQLDRAITRTDRGKFLRQLVEEFPTSTKVAEGDGGIVGDIMVRPGSDALQIGPCVASSGAGKYLLIDACNANVGRNAYWDIPELNSYAAGLAKDLGLSRQRSLLRMCRGVAVNDDSERLWASSGPELG